MNSDAFPRPDLDASVNAAIQKTERYYREQIFSSGCSSLVPIYRIADNIHTESALIKQLEGSPYIQSRVEFSPRVIETLLDVNIFRFQSAHFFFQGDVRPELAQFVEQQCVQVESFSSVAKPQRSVEAARWTAIDQGVDAILSTYPVLQSIDYKQLVKQVVNAIRSLNFDETLESYLDIFYQPEWKKKLLLNQSSLLCMVHTANMLRWNEEGLRDLVILGILKDIGYARLNEQIVDFEVLHPLVSVKLLEDCNDGVTEDRLITQNTIDAVTVHHEFADMSGPLARMRHPRVMSVLSQGMPLASQISGLCDLFFGFLDKYSPGLAFSITCGFVLGQGDVRPRYERSVVEAFIEALQRGSYGDVSIRDDEGEELINNILGVLKQPAVRAKATSMIFGKSASWYERITLALNIVRNIAHRQPDHVGDVSLMNALYLPVEFGLNY